MVAHLEMVHAALEVHAAQEVHFAEEVVHFVEQEVQEVQDHPEYIPPDCAALAHPGGHQAHCPQALHCLAHLPHQEAGQRH